METQHLQGTDVPAKHGHRVATSPRDGDLRGKEQDALKRDDVAKKLNAARALKLLMLKPNRNGNPCESPVKNRSALLSISTKPTIDTNGYFSISH